MTDVEHITVEILKQIRDEIRTTREDLGARIDQTNSRIDRLGAELGGRIDQTNLRLDKVEGTLLDLAEQQTFRNAKRSAARERANA
jgi:hypothetical protein